MDRFTLGLNCLIFPGFFKKQNKQESKLVFFFVSNITYLLLPMAREEDIEASASITDHLLTRPLGHEDTQVTHERLTWRGANLLVV